MLSAFLLGGPDDGTCSDPNFPVVLLRIFMKVRLRCLNFRVLKSVRLIGILMIMVLGRRPWIRLSGHLCYSRSLSKTVFSNFDWNQVCAWRPRRLRISCRSAWQGTYVIMVMWVITSFLFSSPEYLIPWFLGPINSPNAASTKCIFDMNQGLAMSHHSIDEQSKSFFFFKYIRLFLLTSILVSATGTLLRLACNNTVQPEGKMTIAYSDNAEHHLLH